MPGAHHDRSDFAERIEPGEAYRRHRDDLFNYFRRCGLPRHAAEDQLQGVFVVVLENLARFDPDRGSLRSYLFGIARNRRLAWHRTRRRQAEEARVDRSPAVADRAETALVRDAVRRLPDPQRETLILREFHGFDYEEIGRLQGVPVGTVRSRLFRAREALRRRLHPDDEERR